MRGRWALFLSPKWIAFHLVVIIAAATLFNLAYGNFADSMNANHLMLSSSNASVSQLSHWMFFPDDVVIDSDGADVLAAGIEWRSATVSGTIFLSTQCL